MWLSRYACSEPGKSIATLDQNGKPTGILDSVLFTCDKEGEGRLEPNAISGSCICK